MNLISVKLDVIANQGLLQHPLSRGN